MENTFGLFVIFFIGVVVSFLFYSRTFTPEEIYKAERLCYDSNSEIKKLEASHFTNTLTCENGAVFTYESYYYAKGVDYE